MSFSHTAVLAFSLLVSAAMAQTATSSAATAVVTPTPTQPDMIDDCRSFYNVQNNDTCAVIAAKFDLNFEVFDDWNPSVGALCPDLFLRDWV